ncbi:hypothetical protein [Branchiibius sp. NY16-3462-2]|uniref:hypothetical protein n=1 Tax=Branchiibius sp. NY16-3462-2 TaxID=1807500 RepID=UPI0007913912|nr:hypothetical protein [Branchiibius sp. NY16-3462-2]KYH46206.1 hypothetical protein AZH51_11325 [Branchiibius sp. NY16-3462-2]
MDLQQLKDRQSTAFFPTVIRRFREIDGGNQAGLLSLTLFTTVLPLIILGFGYLSGFASNISVGVLFDRQLGLTGDLAKAVRDAFGTADGLRSSWTILGLAGFLVWGIPMTVQVAGIFAAAWRREMLPFSQRLWRGTVWFLAYLISLALHDMIAFGSDHPVPQGIALYVVSLLPIWLFWTITPALLVHDGGRGARFLATAGLAGLAIDGVILPLLLRVISPPLLESWDGFGAIGVAMTIIIWCGAIAVGWVLTACCGAVLWERVAPASIVEAAESDSAQTTG